MYSVHLVLDTVSNIAQWCHKLVIVVFSVQQQEDKRFKVNCGYLEGLSSAI